MLPSLGKGGLYLWHSPNPLNLWCQSPCGLGYMIAWFLQDRKASAKRKLHSWPHVIFFNIHLLSVFLDLFFSLLLCLCLCSSSSYYYCVLIFLLLCYFYRSLLLFFAHCNAWHMQNTCTHFLFAHCSAWHMQCKLEVKHWSICSCSVSKHVCSICVQCINVNNYGVMAGRSEGENQDRDMSLSDRDMSLPDRDMSHWHVVNKT